MPRALRFQDFDTDAFRIPFYRLVDPRSMTLDSELDELAGKPPFIVDAKLQADDIGNGAHLMRLGFRKICTQIELQHSLNSAPALCPRAEIRDRVVLPEPVIAAHAGQFVFDRFALDVELSAVGHDRLYRNWIRNSLEGGQHSVAVSEEHFITFKKEWNIIKIDLVSVLRKRRGIALDLLHAILAYAQQHNFEKVKVVTECENLPAIGLYLKAGFVPVCFFSVFHLFRKS